MCILYIAKYNRYVFNFMKFHNIYYLYNKTYTRYTDIRKIIINNIYIIPVGVDFNNRKLFFLLG